MKPLLVLGRARETRLPHRTVEKETSGMAVRVFVKIQALPGKGGELAKARSAHHDEVRAEPGCEQFDLFQNVEDPDKLLLVERWTDEASLAAHAERNRQRPQVGADLRVPNAPGQQERYIVD
jgi:quinol monooxygenase YgiN